LVQKDLVMIYLILQQELHSITYWQQYGATQVCVAPSPKPPLSVTSSALHSSLLLFHYQNHDLYHRHLCTDIMRHFGGVIMLGTFERTLHHQKSLVQPNKEHASCCDCFPFGTICSTEKVGSSS